MGDGGCDLRKNGEALVFDEQMVGIDQQADAGMGDFLRELPALGDGIEDVGFLPVEMLDREGDAVVFRDRAEVAQEVAELHPGGFARKSRGDISRARAAEDYDRRAEARGRGQGRSGVVQGGGEIGGGTGEADFRRKEIVADLAGEAGALEAGDEAGERGFGQDGEIAEGEFDVVEAERGQLFDDFDAHGIGGRSDHAAAAAEAQAGRRSVS